WSSERRSPRRHGGTEPATAGTANSLGARTDRLVLSPHIVPPVVSVPPCLRGDCRYASTRRSTAIARNSNARYSSEYPYTHHDGFTRASGVGARRIFHTPRSSSPPSTSALTR